MGCWTALTASGWALGTFGLDARFQHSAAESEGPRGGGHRSSISTHDWRTARLNIRGQPRGRDGRWDEGEGEGEGDGQDARAEEGSRLGFRKTREITAGAKLLCPLRQSSQGLTIGDPSHTVACDSDIGLNCVRALSTLI